MKQTTERAAWPTLGTLLAALLVGLLVFILLFPASGTDTLPPHCWAFLLYPVPCEPWVAPLAGAATAGLIGLGLWIYVDRGRK